MVTDSLRSGQATGKAAGKQRNPNNVGSQGMHIVIILHINMRVHVNAYRCINKHARTTHSKAQAHT